MQAILDAANKYAVGLKNVQARREAWIKKSEEVKAQLKEIADYLNKNSQSKIGYYVDSYYAFDETINGACIEMPSVTFRSGDIAMDLTFRNDDGNVISYTEKGFQITFNPSPTGEIVIWLLPHHNNLQSQPPQYLTIAIIDDVSGLNRDAIEDVVSKGMEAAFYSSFTGITEAKNQPHPYSPIGFKRFETTQPQEDGVRPE